MNVLTTDYNKRYGASGEQEACDYLIKNGYKIIERNFRSRWGEVDIIAKDGFYLCFIEVKRRKNSRNGYPQEAVTRQKISRICRTALYYLKKNNMNESVSVRFDIAVILAGEVEIIKDAFSFYLS